MAKGLEYTGTVDRDHPFEVRLQYCWWPPLFSDQWFLPRLKLRIKNLGKAVQRGSIEIDITEFDNVKELAQVGSYRGPFQDVFHYEISDLLPGKQVKFTFRIASRFLRPGEYVLRVMLKQWIPSDSPIREMMKQLQKENIPEQQKSEMRRIAEEHMRQMAIDPYAVPRGQYTARQLFDLRFVERLKIHSLVSTATIMGAFIGSGLAAGGMFVYATIKVIQENWGAIRALFR